MRQNANLFFEIFQNSGFSRKKFSRFSILFLFVRAVRGIQILVYLTSLFCKRVPKLFGKRGTMRFFSYGAEQDPFAKGRRLTFSFPKRKSYKKKLASVPLERFLLWQEKPVRLCAKARTFVRNRSLGAGGIAPPTVLLGALIKP